MKLNITVKLWLVLVAVTLTLMVGLGWYSYIQTRASLLAEVTSELTSQALEKEKGISLWLQERRTQVERYAFLFTRGLPRYTTQATPQATPQATTDPLSDPAIIMVLNEELAVRSGKESGILDMEIIDAKTGKIVSASQSRKIGQYREHYPFFQPARQRTITSPVYYAMDAQEPRISISTPLFRDAKGAPLSLLVAHVNLETAQSITDLRSGLRRTQDAYLLDSARALLTQPRAKGESGVMRRIINSEAVNRCVARENGVFIGPGHNAIVHIHVFRWQPSIKACLMVELDIDDALAPVRMYANSLLLGLVIALIAASLLAYGLAYSISHPVQQLQRAISQFSETRQLPRDISASRQDEIGTLARTIQEMASQINAQDQTLREYSSSLERQVALRTAALAKSEARFRAVVDNSSDPLITTDAQGGIVLFNNSAERCFGYTKEEVIGKHIALIFQASFQNAFRARLETDAQIHKNVLLDHVIELVAVRKNGEEFPIDLSLAQWETNGESYFTAILRDISERKQWERAVKRSNEELERFAYVASHDLQEPLRMVASFTQLLADRYQGKLDAEANEFIAYAVDGAKRMQALIIDLLNYSRITTQVPSLTTIDCNVTLDRVLVALQVAINESGATIKRMSLPTVQGNTIQLNQLFQNLISNALKFRGTESPIVDIGVAPLENEWLFHVKDNGIGIAQQHIGKLFVLFKRLHTRQKYPGTGLGLAICKKIIEQHGGRIWAESEEGRGTCIFFTLPMSENMNHDS